MTPGMGVGHMGPCCPHPNCGGTPGQGVGLMGPVGQTGPGWNVIGMQIGCENPSETPPPFFRNAMQCNAMYGPWDRGGTDGSLARHDGLEQPVRCSVAYVCSTLCLFKKSIHAFLCSAFIQ